MALVIRTRGGKLVIFESLRESGVQIVDWDRFKAKKWHLLYTKITYRKLHHSKENFFTEVIEDFVKQSVGKPFKINPSKLLRKKNDNDNAANLK